MIYDSDAYASVLCALHLCAYSDTVVAKTLGYQQRVAETKLICARRLTTGTCSRGSH